MQNSATRSLSISLNVRGRMMGHRAGDDVLPGCRAFLPTGTLVLCAIRSGDRHHFRQETLDCVDHRALQALARRPPSDSYHRAAARRIFVAPGMKAAGPVRTLLDLRSARIGCLAAGLVSKRADDDRPPSQLYGELTTYSLRSAALRGRSHRMVGAAPRSPR